MIKRKPFYFLRHGETDSNVNKLFCGNDNVPLNRNGIQQASSLIKDIKKLQINHIFSSPLKRALNTAKIVNQSLSFKITIFKNLKEVNFGILERKKYDTKESKKHLKNWLEGNTPKNVEPYLLFKKRIQKTINKCLEKENIPLIVSHGSFFMTLSEILGKKKPIELENCGLVYVYPSKLSNMWNINFIKNKSINT